MAFPDFINHGSARQKKFLTTSIERSLFATHLLSLIIQPTDLVFLFVEDGCRFEAFTELPSLNSAPTTVARPRPQSPKLTCLFARVNLLNLTVTWSGFGLRSNYWN